MQALLVDLGNSRWKMALAAGTDVGTVSSGDYDERHEFESAAGRLAESAAYTLLASVVNQGVTNTLVEALRQLSKSEVRLIAATDQMPGVVSGYTRPSQLGVDRLLAMVAARALTVQPLVVVDAGTAITIDFVDAGGLHLGGVILPGPDLARTSLLSNTSVSHDAQIDLGALLGRDTPTAVALGVRYAVAGIVERFTIGSAALFPDQQVQIVFGGGAADIIAGLLPKPHRRVDELVLHGLAVVASHEDL